MTPGPDGTRLPQGRPGQALALALLAALLALAWFVIGDPVLQLYAGREADLAARRLLSVRMSQVEAGLPALQRQSATVAAPTAVPVLDGATDAVAGAQLQQAVQDMAVRAGAPLSSVELLTAETAGGYRRIGLRVALNAPWPAMIGLLGAIAQATPAMTVDDLQVHGSRGFIQEPGAALDASWTVTAFRPGAVASGVASGVAAGLSR